MILESAIDQYSRPSLSFRPKRKRPNGLKYSRTRAMAYENGKIENVRSVAIAPAWCISLVSYQSLRCRKCG